MQKLQKIGKNSSKWPKICTNLYKIGVRTFLKILTAISGPSKADTNTDQSVHLATLPCAVKIAKNHQSHSYEIYFYDNSDIFLSITPGNSAQIASIIHSPLYIYIVPQFRLLRLLAAPTYFAPSSIATAAPRKHTLTGHLTRLSVPTPSDSRTTAGYRRKHTKRDSLFAIYRYLARYLLERMYTLFRYV